MQRRSWLAALLVAGALAEPAAAQQVLLMLSPAMICSDHAQQAADGRIASSQAVATCTASLRTEPLTQEDKLGVLMNRGVLYLSMRQLDLARADFDAAAALRPDLGDVYVNRSAVLIGQGRHREALAEVERGLALELVNPERGYFNRAVAKEMLSDIPGAYQDYRRALELRPGWDRPQAELERFSLRSR